MIINFELPQRTERERERERDNVMTTRPALTTLSMSEEEAEPGNTWVVLNEEEGSSPTLPLGFGK